MKILQWKQPEQRITHFSSNMEKGVRYGVANRD